MFCSLPEALSLCGDVQHAVGIDVKGDLDLRHAAWCWRNSIQVELAERLVVVRHRTLTLQDVDLHAWLIVSCR